MNREVAILTVLRVPPDARLIVQVGQERFESISEVHNATVRQQLMAAIGELIEFAGGYSTLVGAGVAPNLSTGESTRVVQEATDAPQQAAISQSEERDGDSLKQSVPTESDSQPAVTTDVETGSEIFLNLVEEIDAVLQRNLLEHPSLSGRSIHLESDLHGQVLIEVDGEIYTSVDQIDDEEVKEAIVRARGEWERR